MHYRSPLLKENRLHQKTNVFCSCSNLFDKMITTAILLPKEHIHQQLSVNFHVPFLSCSPLQYSMGINLYVILLSAFVVLFDVCWIHAFLHQFMEFHNTTLFLFFFCGRRWSYLLLYKDLSAQELPCGDCTTAPAFGTLTLLLYFSTLIWVYKGFNSCESLS